MLTAVEIEEAANFLHQPGIGVTRDAHIALAAGKVTAMHDPTEGGLAGALWELADACGHAILVEPDRVHIPELSAKVCQVFGLDPLATIASGALLLAVRAGDSEAVRIALSEQGVPCTQIGVIEAGESGLWQFVNGERSFWPRPARDEIGKVYEA